MATAKCVQEIDPCSVKEALSRSDGFKWKQAMDEEIKSLQENDTWDIVQRPNGKNIVTCKWVFKTKCNLKGEIERYKARLVARGFSQKYGVDYDEVFAPVVKQITFRTLLSVAGHKLMVIKHYDAKTACLNGDLNEEVFMSLPEGYDFGNNKYAVCKLKKGLNGLKQSAKLWNDKLNSILKEFGFLQSESDPCLYTKRLDGEFIYIIIHVDDFLVAAKSEKVVNQVGDLLSKQFHLVDLGLLKKYLGVEVSINKEGFYCISQKQYIEAILHKFNLQDAKESKIPLDTGYYKTRAQSTAMPQSEKYQQLIGALLYLAVNTRPDITASVNILSQHNKQPTQADWNEVKRVCRYLKGTKDYQLILGNQQESTSELEGYADADWAENREDRKSNSGYIFKFMGATVSWACRKQTCVALSSTEAEYIALAEASQECLWLKRLIKDFTAKQQKSTPIFEDNQSCLNLASNKRCSRRTKHIDTKFHFIRDLKENGILNFVYCPTEKMLADMLTNPLGNIKLRSLAQGCGLSSE